MRIPLASRCRVLLLGLLFTAVSACTSSAPTPGPPELPLVPCPLDVPGAPTAPPGYAIVPPGRIAFTVDAWHNLTPVDRHCGAQAVRGAGSTFDLSSLGGEDGILWVATLARPGPGTAPDPVPPTVTLSRLDAAGSVELAFDPQTPFGTLQEQYRMMGSYGHGAKIGSYAMRITTGDGVLLAEGRFEIVP